jgi:hypothetical protein
MTDNIESPTRAASLRVYAAIGRGERADDADLRDCSEDARTLAQAVGRTMREGSKVVPVTLLQAEPTEITTTLPTTVDVQVNPLHVVAFLLGDGWTLHQLNEHAAHIATPLMGYVVVPIEADRFTSGSMAFAIVCLARVYKTEPYTLWERIVTTWDRFKVSDSNDYIKVEHVECDSPPYYMVLLNGAWSYAWSNERNGFSFPAYRDARKTRPYEWTLREAIDEAVKAVAFRSAQLKVEASK